MDNLTLHLQGMKNTEIKRIGIYNKMLIISVCDDARAKTDPLMKEEIHTSYNHYIKKTGLLLFFPLASEGDPTHILKIN